jgi:hypothetical protein
MGNISIFITGRLFRGVSEIAAVCRERKEEREAVGLIFLWLCFIGGNNTRELGYL